MEIGVYSGGSLKMWREYLGDRCFVYGVDITTECKAYEDEWTKIYIGDQEDRAFWRTFKSEGIELDIVIDDGGHTPEQQIATLEEMLPFLKHGGVYVCEDAHGELHEFNAYLFGLSQHLHTYDMYASDKTSGDFCHASAFQSEVHSIHIYPYMTVIEKNECCIPTLSGPRRGTLWNPVYAGKPDIAPELLSEKGAEGPSD